MEYKFIHEDKEYVLTEENCEGIFFADENVVTGLSEDIILTALNEGEEVTFTNEYYSSKCSCDTQEQINKSYRYIECHFYIYTKDNDYIINTLSEEYKNTSFNKLFSLNEIDDSYIVSILLCPSCGTYSIEIEQCTV